MSDFCSGSAVGASSSTGGITTGTAEATTASQHWHTVRNSERRSWKERELSGVNVSLSRITSIKLFFFNVSNVNRSLVNNDHLDL